MMVGLVENPPPPMPPNPVTASSGMSDCPGATRIQVPELAWAVLEQIGIGCPVTADVGVGTAPSSSGTTRLKCTRRVFSTAGEKICVSDKVSSHEPRLDCCSYPGNPEELGCEDADPVNRAKSESFCRRVGKSTRA